MTQSDTEETYKPKRIRPLMIPCGVLSVPDPIVDFTRYAIRRRLKFETRHEPLAVVGVLTVGERSIRGSIRPLAALKDGAGRSLWIDVDPTDFGAYLKLFEIRGRRVCLFGRVFEKGRHWFIENPEPIGGRWVGSPRPVYEIHSQTREALIRRTDSEMAESYLLDARIQNEYRRGVNDASVFRGYLNASKKKLFEDVLKDIEAVYVATGEKRIKAAEKVLDETLTGVHSPESGEHFEQCMDRIRRIAAVAVIFDRVKEGLRERKERLRQSKGLRPARLADWVGKDYRAAVDHYATTLPFPLTEEQSVAAADILQDMNDGAPMRRVLSGDVGSGKTAVYAIAVRAAIDAGIRVGVVLPSTILAKQISKKMTEFVPEARITTVTHDLQVDHSANLWVGTVGIQSVTDEDFGLYIVDEQQKFSRSQRDGAVHDECHLLEVTATCIPRTQSLLESKLMDITRLRECHVKKEIKSRVWEDRDRKKLFQEIRADVAAGSIVMVIYVGKVITDQNESNHILSIEEFRSTWEDLFPGQIAVCHGGQTAEENDAAIASVTSLEKKVLLATSIVEVGIDIPDVRRVTVIQADRFGMSTLHQLRGRAGRNGGQAHCDLVLVNDTKEHIRERLDYFTRTTDGFKIAEFDLANRGAGDAAVDGHKQSGKLPKSPFKGYEPSQEMVSIVAAELAEVYENGIPEA